MNKHAAVLALAFSLVAVSATPVARAADAAGAAAATLAATAPAAAPAGGEIEPLAPESTDQIRKDMEQLVQAAVKPLAETLETGDHFTPYGVLQMKDGQLQSVKWTKPNPPEDMEVFRQINLAIRASSQNPEVLSAATVAPTSLPTSDGRTQVRAIRVEVDHREGSPLVVVIPFGRENGKLVLGTLIYRVGRNPMFPHVEPAAEPAAAAVPAKSAAKAAARPAAKPAKPKGDAGRK